MEPKWFAEIAPYSYFPRIVPPPLVEQGREYRLVLIFTKKHPRLVGRLVSGAQNSPSFQIFSKAGYFERGGVFPGGYLVEPKMTLAY